MTLYIFKSLQNSFPQDAFQRSYGQIKAILKEVNSEFKTYKSNMEYLRRGVRRQKYKVENLIKNSQPQARIDEETAKQKRLEQELRRQMKGKWMLDIRDLMQNPQMIKVLKHLKFITGHPKKSVS